MKNIDISVVIPTKNGERYLDAALSAVFSQKTRFGFEVIIIDSGSTDNTLAIAKRYPARLYQIAEKDFNHGLTRNFGISKALGRYVILMTQDAVPYNERWMEKMADSLEGDNRAAGVYSRHIPHADSSIYARLRTGMFFSSAKEGKVSSIDRLKDYEALRPFEKYRFCNFDNVSSCVRKSVWEGYKFPDTDFGEDIEWSKLVLEAGYNILYEHESIVCHSHDYSVSAWYKRNIANYSKLRSLFGIHGADSACGLLAFSFIRALRDLYAMLKYYMNIRNASTLLSIIHLVPVYSFAGALGQYRGIRKSKAKARA